MRIVVVGGGIVGASSAYHLSRFAADGPTDIEIVVVDRNHPGKATLAGAGIVCPWPSSIGDGAYLDLYLAGADYYPTLISELVGSEDPGPSLGYRRVGALVLSAHEYELDEALDRTTRRVGGRTEIGPIARITNAEARTRFPPLRTGVDAVHVPGAARVDGRLLTESILNATRIERVVVRPETTELIVEGGRVTGLRADGDRIDADQVVVAGGAWTNELLRPLGSDVTVDVEPQKGQIVHLRVDADTSAWPVLMPVGGQYLVGFDDSRVVVGATRETGSGFDTTVTAGGQAEVLAAALDIAPGLADSEIIETRVGLRPLAADVPTVGRPSAIDGLVVGTGMGAGGLTMGPYCGRLLAEIALGRQPSFDVTPYAPGARTVDQE